MLYGIHPLSYPIHWKIEIDQFILRLNNHVKDLNRHNAPLVDQHLKLPGQNSINTLSSF